jgi:hypothetical protein
LVAEALADARHHPKKRLHDNQLDWTRFTRGAQLEVMVRREPQAPVDGRQRCDERQRNNQPDKRREGGMMRGSTGLRGRGTGGWEVAAFQEEMQQSAR